MDTDLPGQRLVDQCLVQLVEFLGELVELLIDLIGSGLAAFQHIGDGSPCLIDLLCNVFNVLNDLGDRRRNLDIVQVHRHLLKWTQ